MARSNRGCYLNLSLGIKCFTVLIIVFQLSSCVNVDNGASFSTDDLSYKTEGFSFYGNTQGTTYAILINDPISITQTQIDSQLHLFDLALSTYIPESIISKFNALSSGTFNYTDTLNYFNDCMTMSQSIFETTKGDFDPSVFPLLEIWGFLKDVDSIPDSLSIANTLKKIRFKNDYHYQFIPSNSPGKQSVLIKRTLGFKIVFNAIAQGQAVDVISKLLEAKGSKNYFVEIGGEIKVKGRNSEGKIWSIGIDKPIENSTARTRELMTIVKLKDKSIATSGSYRQFYEKKGKKYSHTINPHTGYPIAHQLLSVSVIANSCANADGYATAFMVMGKDKTISFIDEHQELNLDAFLIYNNSNNQLETFATKGFQKLINQ